MRIHTFPGQLHPCLPRTTPCYPVPSTRKLIWCCGSGLLLFLILISTRCFLSTPSSCVECQIPVSRTFHMWHVSRFHNWTFPVCRVSRLQYYGSFRTFISCRVSQFLPIRTVKKIQRTAHVHCCLRLRKRASDFIIRLRKRAYFLLVTWTSFYAYENGLVKWTAYVNGHYHPITPWTSMFANDYVCSIDSHMDTVADISRVFLESVRVRGCTNSYGLLRPGLQNFLCYI